MSTSRVINGGGLQFLISADYPTPTEVVATSPMELRETYFPAPRPGEVYAQNRIYVVDIQQASPQAPVTMRGALSPFGSFQIPLLDPGAATPAGVVVAPDSGANVPVGSKTWTITAPVLLRLGRTAAGWELVP